MSELKIPDGLKARYKKLNSLEDRDRWLTASEREELKYIERIARLEQERDALRAQLAAVTAPVTEEEADTYGCYMCGNHGWCDGIRFTPYQVDTLITTRLAKVKP